MRQVFCKRFLHIPVILLHHAALILGCGSDSVCNNLDAPSQDDVVFDKRCPSHRNLFHQEPLEAPDSCPDVPAPKNCLSDNQCPHGSYCCLSICEGITRCYDPIRDKFMTSAHNETNHHHNHHKKKKERICSGSSSEDKECEWVSSEETVEVSASEDEDQSGDRIDSHGRDHRHDRERHHHSRHDRHKGSKHDHKGSHGKAGGHHHRHELHENGDGKTGEKDSRSNEESSREGEGHTKNVAHGDRTAGAGANAIEPEGSSTVWQGQEPRKAGGFSGYQGMKSGSNKKSNKLWKGKSVMGTENDPELAPSDHPRQPEAEAPKQKTRKVSSKKERRANQKQKHDAGMNLKPEHHDVPGDGNAISFIDSVHNSILNFKK